MNLARRAWRVLTDTPTSTAAACLRFLISFEALWAAVHFPPIRPFTRPADGSWPYFALYFVCLCVALHFVRQRDEARADAAALRKTEGSLR